MDLDALLTQPFAVSDTLDASSRAALASACQPLDIPPARPSLGTAEFARVEAARRKALGTALTGAFELVESSRFDLQVLTVLMRLLIEVDGLQGARGALRLLCKLLENGWGDLDHASAGLAAADRERVDRRRGGYVDAVFQQLYFWLAREQDRAAPALAGAAARDTAEWTALLGEVDARLMASTLRVSSWEHPRQALSSILRPEREVRSGDAAASGEASPTSQASAQGAATESAPGALEQPAHAAPAPSPRNVSGAPTAVLEVSARFWELQQRLAAFAELVSSGQFEKAAIVLQDLQQTLEHFDVAAHFPGLFADFFELSARHAEPLSRRREPASARSSALAQLYRTDVTRFIRLSVEGNG